MNDGLLMDKKSHTGQSDFCLSVPVRKNREMIESKLVLIIILLLHLITYNYNYNYITLLLHEENLKSLVIAQAFR